MSIGYEALHVLALADSEMPIMIDSSFIRDTFIVPSLHMLFRIYVEYIENVYSSISTYMLRSCMRSQMDDKTICFVQS